VLIRIDVWIQPVVTPRYDSSLSLCGSALRPRLSAPPRL
jgi:hypothetical protein